MASLKKTETFEVQYGGEFWKKGEVAIGEKNDKMQFPRMMAKATGRC